MYYDIIHHYKIRQNNEATIPFAMPSNCTAYNCFNRSDKGYALVRYPRNEIIKQKWIAAVGRGKNWSPSASQKLCEVHFKSSEIEFVAGRKRVKSDSVPSRFCTCPSKDHENYLKNRNNLTSGSSEYIINMIDHCDHTYNKILKGKQKYRNGPYQHKVSVRKHNNDCCVMQLPIKKNEILANKQEEIIEDIRRENDLLRTVVSLLQKILQNRKQS